MSTGASWVALMAVAYAAMTLLVVKAGTPEVVQTKYGQVRGFREDYGTNGSYVLHFLGIPYALLPTGDRRFRPPQDPSPWSGVRDATRWSDGCPQVPYLEDKNFTFSEDCLYVNVYAPKEAADGGLAVLVWVHGGGYEKGTGVTRQGNVLARRGVVVVTFNYRLGPLGFLTTMDDAAPGNYGMLDQVKALEWVKNNIAAFGGDPAKVTVFGESAGGYSVSLHLLSPLSQGLFRAAIMESGVSICDHSVAFTSDDPSPSQHARDLGAALGCHQTDSAALTACLRQKPALSLVQQNVPGSSTRITWSPVVDSHFLPDAPLQLLERGLAAKVPVIRGCNADESSIFGAVVGVPNIEQGLDFGLFQQLVKNMTLTYFPHTSHRPQIEADIIRVYSQHLNTSDTAAVRQAYIQLWTDHDFCAPAMLESELTSRSADLPPVYFYAFDHLSPFSPWPRWKGVPHASELLYVFGFPFLPPSQGPVTVFNQQWTQEDKDISDDMMTLWSNFAKFSNPTPQPVKGVTWRPFSPQHPAFLQVTGGLSLGQNYRSRENKLWNVDVPRLANLGPQTHIVG